MPLCSSTVAFLKGILKLCSHFCILTETIRWNLSFPQSSATIARSRIVSGGPMVRVVIDKLHVLYKLKVFSITGLRCKSRKAKVESS